MEKFINYTYEMIGFFAAVLGFALLIYISITGVEFSGPEAAALLIAIGTYFISTSDNSKD